MEIGQTMGLSGDDLRKFVEDEKNAAISEKEKERALDLEKAKIAADAEIEKAKLLAGAEKSKFEAEKAKLDADEREKQRADELAKAKLDADERDKLAKAKFDADEKARDRSANLEIEKAKFAAEAEKAKIDADKAKFAAEIERAKINAETDRIRLAAEEKERERVHERETLQQRNEHDLHRMQADTHELDSRGRDTHSLNIRKIKLPMFNEEKDDLDAFLLRFERACETYGVKDEEKSMQLAQLLQGKSLEVYERLPFDEVQSYRSLKEHLMRRFRLTEGGYRRKFRESRIETGETPEQFTDRLRRYLTRWCEMAGFEADYEGLENLIIRDQYFSTCSRDLQMFLKEQGKMNLKQMTEKASNYIDAHGFQSASNSGWKTNKERSNNTSSQHTAPTQDKTQKCDICHRTNHSTSEHRGKPPVNTTNYTDKPKSSACYNCGREGHRAISCKEPKRSGFQKAGAMQIVPEPIQVNATPSTENHNHQCTSSNKKGEVQLSCGCFVPVVAGAWSDNGRIQLEKLKATLNPCCTGKLNGFETHVLRDTGCSTVVVKTSLVKPEQMTGDSELCILIDGAAKRFPTAFVDLDTPYFKGKAKALCMENPIQEIIIGNIPGALDPQNLQYNTVCDKQETNTSENKSVDKTEETVITAETNKDPEPDTGGANSKTAETHKDPETDTGGANSETTQVDSAAAVETRAMVINASKPKHSLKVPEIPGIDIGVDKLKELQVQDESLKKAWEMSKETFREDAKINFVVKNGILYRGYRDGRDGDRRYQLAVPKELRDKVFSLGHETLLSGHRGAAKTVSRISQDFYYPGMFQDLRDRTWSCDVCQRSVSKGSVGKAPMGKLPLIGVPFSVVCVDIVGPLTPPSDGHRYILTIIDQCTRFPEAIPLKDIETATVAEALMSTFSRVGLPDRVHSDCGSQFTSAMMGEVYRLMSIKRTTTAPYNPAGNGIVENFNKTIKNMLKKVAVERPKDWSRYLAPLMFAVRDTVQDSTGFSPFELLYGRTVRTPMTMLKELWTGEVEEPELKTTYQYVLDLRERIEETCALAKEELGKVQTRNQQYYNRRTRNRQLRVGDSVLLLLPTEHNKMLLSWQGPYKVVAKVGDVDYRIEMFSGRIKTFHVNMLKKYYQREEVADNTSTNKQNTAKDNTPDTSTDTSPLQSAAAIACVLEDSGEIEENESTVRDSDTLPLYSVVQKETVDDVQINPTLTSEQKKDIRALLLEYREIFTDIPKVTHLAEHKVLLTQQEPVRCKGYPLPYQLETIINKELDDMLAMGIIERSDAAYASPMVLVKKSDGTYRTCINFKELNKITVFDPEPMMSPDDIFPKLSGSKFYSTFDFCKGYWAIPMEETSKDCTSFITPRGLMRFRVMPFGMVNAGSTYNRMVRKLLDGSKNLESYVDDIIGYSQDWAYHLGILRDLFERVKRANLSLKPSKCKIGFDTVDFLGHTLKSDFIGPQSETVGRILMMTRPQTKRQCRSLLGLVNFYRRYIPDCATLVAPISDLTKSKAPNKVEWGEFQECAFLKLKDILSSEPILKLPDLQKDFVLQTDASNLGIGACLFQEHDGKKHPVLYASKKLLDREQNYSVGEREALAIVWAVSKFHRFLYGRHFILESDHRPLQYLNSTDSKSPRLMRWSLALQPYRYTVKYIRGEDNFCADYLSRC